MLPDVLLCFAQKSVGIFFFKYNLELQNYMTVEEEI